MSSQHRSRSNCGTGLPETVIQFTPIYSKCRSQRRYRLNFGTVKYRSKGGFWKSAEEGNAFFFLIIPAVRTVGKVFQEEIGNGRNLQKRVFYC